MRHLTQVSMPRSSFTIRIIPLKWGMFTSQPSDHSPVLILGGGISGLSAAWRLAERGISVHIFESQSTVGGLAGTVREDGYSLDYGPHSFFSEDSEISETVLNLFPSDGMRTIPRDVKFYYRGRHMNYPFTPSDLLFQMGFKNASQVIWSFLKSRKTSFLAPEDDLSVEDWAISSFGPHLYQTFFKPYTEQFWKISCSELSARSIPSHTRLSFVQTLKHLFQSSSKNAGKNMLEREKLPTYYPPTGYGEISEKVAERLQRAGGQIHVNAQVTQVSHDASGVSVSYIQEGEKKTISGSKIISTLPLPVLCSMLEPALPKPFLEASQNLEYRPLLFLGLVTTKQKVLPCSYMYVLDRPYNRLTEMSRFSPETSPKGENIIGLEIPCRADEHLWNASKEQLFEDCAAALKRDRILERSDIHKLLLLKARYAYPVYRKNYTKSLNLILEWIQQHPRLQTLGRNGEFRYMDADQCMRRAFDLVDRLSRTPEKNYAALEV